MITHSSDDGIGDTITHGYIRCPSLTQSLDSGWAAGAHSQPNSGVGKFAPSDPRAAASASECSLVAVEVLEQIMRRPAGRIKLV